MLEKGILTKKDLKKLRENLIRKYAKYFTDYPPQWSKVPNFTVDTTPKSDIKRTNYRVGLYLKLLEFDKELRGEESPEAGFYLQALRHIQTMDAKIELGECETNRSEQEAGQEEVEKNLMTCLVERWMDYSINDLDISQKELSRRKQTRTNVLQEFQNLFNVTKLSNHGEEG